MPTPTNARHALRLLLEDVAHDPAIHAKVTAYLEALPAPEPDAYLVEFDESLGQGKWERMRHLVQDKPEGHYLECSTELFKGLDHIQSLNVADLVRAAREVMSYTESSFRPPVRDALECGRMVLVRLHALADLREALLAFEDMPKTLPLAEFPPAIQQAMSEPKVAPDAPLPDVSLYNMTYVFEQMGYVGMDNIRQKLEAIKAGETVTINLEERPDFERPSFPIK